MSDERSIDRIRDNPFYVLELRPSASRAEIERQGQKLLGMLELELKSAAAYATPVGPGERTGDKVRQAMAELRDPERRLYHELWARLDPAKQGTAASPTDDREGEAQARPRPDEPWPEALEALGWRAWRAPGGAGS